MMMAMEELQLPLERDLFFRSIIRTLAGSLEETVGPEEAEGYVSIVGSEIGNWIEEKYCEALGRDKLTPQEVAEVLVDLKRRIGGEFFIESVDDDKIVLGNRKCPFGDLVKGRPSLCQMTNNVFGRISANQAGYSKVDIQETIAMGAPGCHVVVHLRPEPTEDIEGHEFFRVKGPAA
ncbi:methanogen output domain 1-containing protein [Sphingomicrobium lutaoense]|uniref:Putative ArsR family transcriptional regulator n=1 Tax=Sphingomicrobium lutaoense TaxID=515949 RepID=A0A839Z396_9SPHN|nr:methanogen output domain 1-containing protein [Sphingomicrobium lutaoense]MBB3763054.1 putative ArsR family transcriptional regulator [Sphingomicrobium lutaoense]